MHMTINSDDLMVILALSREGTLERAAKSLDKDTSSVFRAIKRIEAKTERALFTRSNRGFQPVPGIERLLQSAQRVNQELTWVNETLNAADQQLSGALKITTTDLLLSDFIAPQLTKFTRQYPLIELHFDTQNPLTRLWELNFDIAIRASNKPPEQMIGKCLMTVEHQVMTLPCWQNAGQLDAGVCWLLPGGEISGHSTAKWFQDTVKGDNRVIRYDSLLQIRQGVVNGQGVACLPDLPVKKALQDLLPVIEYGRFCQTYIWALYHPSKRQNSKIQAFTQFLEQLIPA